MREVLRRPLYRGVIRYNASKKRDQLESYLADWRGFLAANTTQARQALGRLIDGKLTVRPEGEHYAFEGVGTVKPLLSGVVHKVVSPRGMDRSKTKELPWIVPV